jgi:hypothetical protein
VRRGKLGNDEVTAGAPRPDPCRAVLAAAWEVRHWQIQALLPGLTAGHSNPSNVRNAPRETGGALCARGFSPRANSRDPGSS